MKLQRVYEISNKKHRCWVFLQHCLAWFRTLGYFYWSAAEPLADARGTPVENHWVRVRVRVRVSENACCGIHLPSTKTLDITDTQYTGNTQKKRAKRQYGSIWTYK